MKNTINGKQQIKLRMKRIIISTLVLLLSFPILAQQTDFQKAISKYKTAQIITATSVKTRHKAAVAKDEQSSGTFTILPPNKMNISVNEGKDQLDMQGEDFTMTVGGKSHKTSSKTNPQFATFQKVLEHIMTGGADGKDIAQTPGVTIQKEGNNFVLTITPEVAKAKAKKRMMFTSFVITIDTKTAEIKTLRMNEKGQNYTSYEFSGYTFK